MSNNNPMFYLSYALYCCGLMVSYLLAMHDCWVLAVLVAFLTGDVKPTHHCKCAEDDEEEEDRD